MGSFTGKLVTAGVEISMDGRGRFMDNIFIERLWRSIKYEEVHLKAYADGREARAGIGSWMTFYNFRRPHQAMNNQMPMAVWRGGMDKIEAAARAVVKWPRAAGPFLAAVKLEGRLLVVLYQAAKGSVCC